MKKRLSIYLVIVFVISLFTTTTYAELENMVQVDRSVFFREINNSGEMNTMELMLRDMRQSDISTFFEMVENIVAEEHIYENDDDLTKAYKLYRYIIRNYTYGPASQGVSGVVNNGQGVCIDWNVFAAYALESMDIPAYMVLASVETNNRGDHAITRAYIDGSWQVIDYTPFANMKRMTIDEFDLYWSIKFGDYSGIYGTTLIDNPEFIDGEFTRPGQICIDSVQANDVLMAHEYRINHFAKTEFGSRQDIPDSINKYADASSGKYTRYIDGREVLKPITVH